MRGHVLLLVGLMLTLPIAGCLGGDDGGGPGGPGDGSGPAGLQVSPPVQVSERWPGAEPVVDVGPEGTLYYQGIGTGQDETGEHNVNRVWRSTDDGQTWTDITPPATANVSTNDGYVAVGPDGTVFAANVFYLTFQVFKSEDAGETWTPVNIPRVPGLMHRHWIEPVGDGVVHVAVEALDPAAATILGGLPSQEGQLDTQVNTGMYYARSEDNGETWTQPVRIDPQINYAGQSNLAIGPDGQQLYIVRYEETDQEQPIDYAYTDGTFYLVTSQDGGETWERREMFAMEGQAGSALTSLDVAADGAVHFTWAEEEDGRSVTHLATSRDAGATWQVRALDLGEGTQAMPFLRVVDEDRLVLLWYDAHTQGLPSDTDLAADWHVHVAEVTDLASQVPSASVAVASGTVHQGNICVLGPACQGDQDRRLLDYVWVELGPDQTRHLAWASTMWERPSAFPAYASLAPP